MKTQINPAYKLPPPEGDSFIKKLGKKIMC